MKWQKSNNNFFINIIMPNIKRIYVSREAHLQTVLTFANGVKFLQLKKLSLNVYQKLSNVFNYRNSKV